MHWLGVTQVAPGGSVVQTKVNTKVSAPSPAPPHRARKSDTVEWTIYFASIDL